MSAVMRRKRVFKGIGKPILSISASQPTTVTLTWTAARSPAPITNYLVYRDGALIATVGNVLTYQDTGRTGDTLYSYAVYARDVNNKLSPVSNAVRLYTPVNITNPDFTSNVTGWTAINTPTSFTSVGGKAQVVANGTGKGFGQALTLVNGRVYLATYDYVVSQGTGFTVSKVGMTTQNALIGTGSVSFTFTESDGTTRNLLFQTAGIGDHTFTIDNVRFQGVVQ